MIQVEVGDEDRVDGVERPLADWPDEPPKGTDPRLGGRVGQEADPVEIDPDARMAQELDRGGRGPLAGLRREGRPGSSSLAA